MADTRKPETGQGRQNAALPGDASVTPVIRRDGVRRAFAPKSKDYQNLAEDGSNFARDLVRAEKVFNDTLVRLTGNSYRDYGDFFSGMMILSDAHLEEPEKSAHVFSRTFGLKIIPTDADPIEIDQIGVINRYMACIYAYAQDSGRWAIDGQGSILAQREDGGVDKLAIDFDGGHIPSFVLSRSLNPGDEAHELISSAVPFAKMRRVMQWSDDCLTEPFVEVARGMDIGVIAPFLNITKAPEQELQAVAAEPVVRPSVTPKRQSGPSGP